MLGFIVTGLKLVGKIIVKAVKAAVVGAVVGCVSNNWKDLKNTSDDIISRTIDEIDDKQEELTERAHKGGKLTWKEKIAIIALIIKWIATFIYSMIVFAMSCVALIIHDILNLEIKSKTTKEV